MYLRKLIIENIRSIERLEMDFERGREAGWHIVLGTNGSGKSSIVRSIALLLMGEKEAYAARQDFSRWMRSGEETSKVSGALTMDEFFDGLSGQGPAPQKSITATVTLSKAEGFVGTKVEPTFTGERVHRTVWGSGEGWFSASFGPFRRFTGGDRIYDRLFVSNKRLAPHLTALGEDVALTEALSWLTSLYVQSLQDERNSVQSHAKSVLQLVVDFINNSGFFPHGARISSVTNETVLVQDGNEVLVPIDQLSDGYRSALSLTIELIRQMFEIYGFQRMRTAMTSQAGQIAAPGVVAIDEVDAHLHPTWQRDIGRWMRRCFPRVQFIVTTHSPIVCRAIADENGDISGSVWLLPRPGSGAACRRADSRELKQLAFGDLIDAYDTEFFGSNMTRSEEGQELLVELAQLNRKALDRGLSDAENQRRGQLRATLPSNASFE